MPDDKLLLRSDKALGHGLNNEMTSVVYVRSDNFNAADTPAIAREIEKINRQFAADNRHYILIGPGRWGSGDPWLGIPVKWPHIAQSRLIVEVSLPGFRVEPSQGTHFFQNLTSMGAGYFTIDTMSSEGNPLCNFELLDSMPAVTETPHVRVVEFPAPLLVGIDGKKGKGVVALPEQQ